MPEPSKRPAPQPTPAPKLPAPSVPHVYVEKGLGGGAVEKRTSRG